MAFDAILNNFDRLPLGKLWKYELETEVPLGNLGNLLFRKDSGSPVAIDQSITSYDPHTLPDKFDEYSDNLVSIVQECMEALEAGTVSEAFHEISATLGRVFGVEMGNNRMIHVQRGFIKSMKAACGLSSGKIQELYETVRSLFADVILNFPDITERSVGLHLINLQFINTLLSNIRNSTENILPSLNE